MQFHSWIFTFCYLIPFISFGQCSWGAPGDGQYHIQTDEGPERYFRFQTENGQFRKEKRLQDGTVIGTEAWIDAAGFLRQKDYIADKQGYRILKSKTVFVGNGRQIEDAIKSTKSVPAQSGVLVDGNNGGLSARANSVIHSTDATKQGAYIYSTTTPIPVSSSTTRATTTVTPEVPPRLGYLSPAEAAKLEPSGYLGFDHYPDELPRRPASHHHHISYEHEPIVHVRPHSEPIDDEHASNSIVDDYQNSQYQHHHHSATTERPLTLVAPAPAQPMLDMQPPFESKYRRIRPIAVVSSTPPAPITPEDIASQLPRGNNQYGFSTPSPFVSPPVTTPIRNAGYHYGRIPTPTPSPYREFNAADAHPRSSSVPALPYEVNNLESGLLPPPPPSQHNHRRLRPQQSQLQNNVLEDYDGVGVTRNGFRYFLPRHYHEEEQIDEQKRAGSYGYVDPFGIRRVVYYNASPERGFVHRNNNRYVGLGGTPYDPVISTL